VIFGVAAPVVDAKDGSDKATVVEAQNRQTSGVEQGHLAHLGIEPAALTSAPIVTGNSLAGPRASRYSGTKASCLNAL
jgi:hypothetical protein